MSIRQYFIFEDRNVPKDIAQSFNSNLLKLSILCNPQYMQVKYYMHDVYFSQGLSHVLYDLIRDILHFKTMYQIPGIYGLYKDIYNH